jgi:hypothetical protein
MLARLIPAALMVALILVACSDSGDSPTAPTSDGSGGGTGGDTVSFASDVRPILTANCAVSPCHGTGFSQNGMTMGAATHNEIITASGTGSGGLIVQPGNSAQSSLYTKTTGMPPFGIRMPAGGTPLTETQQQTIADWIDQGALDN